MEYFFISGAHKSGTSWLASMLRAHPEVEMPDQELWLFGHPKSLAGQNLRSTVDKWLTIPTVAKEFAATKPERLSPRISRAVISAILRMYRKPMTRALGDKSPLFSLRASKEIRRVFPDARLIIIYRDGRDVAVSHHFHNLRLRDFRKYVDRAEGEAAHRYHVEGKGEAVPLLHTPTLEEVCRNWVQSNAFAHAAIDDFGEDLLMTSYEEIWSDPAPFLVRIFSSLGIRSDSELVGDIVRSKAFSTLTKGRKPGTADPHSFYRTGKPGDWRNYFTADSAVRFNDIAGDWLVKLGYASDLAWIAETEPKSPTSVASL